ncbi:sigma-54-dependent transcriptional regulator [Rhodopirellula sallentina]|uniref:Two component, sigma54 specific, transcriptional regulator, Fis family n=1 Tax=Rhodopirellula sallentina SM41 TaxID=1263870 RepID=M5UG56_9BACT|nr:sigma-54 dependent transcriptional regulator [Rhodopirellula sallentina]EMI56821.1 two component, sigma54 specific, transcriptional regulator, Fis family [Rhodopirellula sallentina SM41]
MNQQPPKILIADDEPLYRETTAEFLREEGFECVCVEDAHDAIDVLQNHSFDLILSDLNMPGNLKLELLQEGRTAYPETPMIIVTGVPSTESAIESVRLGVTDYLLKPVKLDELLVAVQRALPAQPRQTQRQEARPQNNGHAEPLPANIAGAPTTAMPEFGDVIGQSPKMLEVMEIVECVAPSNTSVLITGESGTGKEIIARAIHNRSQRGSKKLQVIDCTAIPDSLFESALFGHVKGSFTGAVKDQAGQLKAADGGTAFFDELGELPLVSQSKLLRVIQEQTFTPVGEDKPVRVDTRFLCATNRDLQAEVDAERFRRDLFYRLAVIHIELPPLRQRGDDIFLLAEYFLDQLRTPGSSVHGFSAETLDCFRRYRWPGNIRELRNVIERSLTLTKGDQVQAADLPAAILDPSDATSESTGVDDLAEISRDEALDRADRAYLSALLERHDGVIAKAARQAGLSRQGMNKLLKRHDIDANLYRG